MSQHHATQHRLDSRLQTPDSKNPEPKNPEPRTQNPPPRARRNSKTLRCPRYVAAVIIIGPVRSPIAQAARPRSTLLHQICNVHECAATLKSQGWDVLTGPRQWRCDGLAWYAQVAGSAEVTCAVQTCVFSTGLENCKNKKYALSHYAVGEPAKIKNTAWLVPRLLKHASIGYVGLNSAY
ncbi:hypothetical protein BDFG_01696 [Blastomyces dermatitidis ATCC 26199]|nr:hypothetical protein BDFG_01696 [Blastomyces dermatitidis ATCC 26199]